MLYSKSLYWFSNVWSEAHQCHIDCLVDLECYGSKGRWVLIDVDGKLKVLSTAEFGKRKSEPNLIIGYPQRCNIPLASQEIIEF